MPARHPMALLYFYPNLSGQDCVVSRQEQAEWGSRPRHGLSLGSPCLPASPIAHSQDGMGWVVPSSQMLSRGVTAALLPWGGTAAAGGQHRLDAMTMVPLPASHSL